MPDISFTIAQRAYTLRCAPGQEDHLRQLAGALDARIEPVAKSAPGADDRRLLVIAALEILDELQREPFAAPAVAASDTPAGAAPEPLPPADNARLSELETENAALRAWAGRMAERLDALIAAAGQPVPHEPDLVELVPDTKDA